MSRTRKSRTPRRSRRQSHAQHAECLRLRAPGTDGQLWVGLCAEVGLWRLRAYGFDAHGVISPDEELIGFPEVAERAIGELGEEHGDAVEFLCAMLRELGE